MAMRLSLVAAVVLAGMPAYARAQPQFPEPGQVVAERAQAELDVPKLVDVLNLQPGMSVADVGAGFGAMSVVLAKWIGTGQVFATDIGKRQLDVLRESVQKEGLQNVTVIEGAAAATNLPAACCDAIFMRDAYHHIGAVEAFNKSLLASLKPGGQLAIIDFPPQPRSNLPPGTPANRGGHGVTAGMVVEELKAAGFTHVRTIEGWPPGDKQEGRFFLALFRK